MAVREVTKLMNESTAHTKEKENEIFAIDIARMTRLHLIYVTFRMGRQNLESHEFTDQKVKTYLMTSLKVFALKQLLIDSQGLYESGFFGLGSGRLLDLSYRALLTEMRPQMLGFIECFPESSQFVPTTIGNAYGDIYEMQFETARNSKMNNGIVPDFFLTHMKPVMTMRKAQVPKL